MRVQLLRSLALPWAIIGVVSILVLTRPATAAPPDNSGQVLGPIAQSSDVTLEKKASAETVPLGEVVSYTVTIKNDGAETVNPTLTDVIPEGLMLQIDSISATTGLVETGDKTVYWEGNLAQGEEATITYNTIPPSTSSPNKTLKNVASLQFGRTTLEAGATITTQQPDRNIWGQFVNFLALILVSFDDFLGGIGIPFAFGFAIIVFTVLVRLATFPLNMQQIKSSKAMQELQPKLKELQEKYKNDKEKLAQEQMAMYKEHGVNPLGGCLPMLVQMPVWFALYQSLLQLSREGLLRQGFFWIPSLAGPVADRTGGIGWLYPFVDGAPPIGWADALAFLVLPILLVVSQLYMQKMMTPPTTDPQQASMQSIMKFMPFMFGYFALVVPSGLTLYWFTSNILAMVQQYFTRTQLTPAPVAAGAAASSPAPANPTSANNPAPANPTSANTAPVNTGGSQRSKKNVKSRRRKKKKTRRKR